jgi:hypothetical protein
MLVSPLFLLVAAAGMETMVYVCLILLTCLAFVGRHHLLAGLLAGAVYTTRPDGLAVFAAFAAVAASRDWFAAPSTTMPARIANVRRG